MSYHDEDELFNEETVPYFLLFGGLIVLVIFSAMVYDTIVKEKNLKSFKLEINNSEIYYDKDSKEYFDSINITLKDVIFNNDESKAVNENIGYRFGLIENSDTIFYKLCLSNYNKNDFYLMKESSERVFGKYTIK